MGLGPYILMEFIDCVSFREVLGTEDLRLLKEEAADTDVEYVYLQMAQIMLSDFDRIGDLPTPRTEYAAPRRPLTWNAQDILRPGGVNTFGLYYVRRSELTADHR